MQRQRGERGVTLIELLVAIVVLGIIAAPILGCIAFVRQSMVEARVQAQVQSALRNAINSRAFTAGTLSSLLSNSLNTTEQLLGGPELVVTTSVSPVANYSNLYSIKATATWTASNTNGRAQTATLETYVASP